MASSWPRKRCCGKSSCFFCPLCCSPLPPDGQTVPRLALPINVAVVLREERQRSTGVHAKVLAPEQVTLYEGDGSDMPCFEAASTVIAYPSAGAQCWEELDNLAGTQAMLNTRRILFLGRPVTPRQPS